MDNLIPLATLQHDPALGPGGKDLPTVSLLCVLHSGPPRPHRCVWRGLCEGGKEVQSAIVHWGKGKGMGRFPKLPSEILLGGKRALPPGRGGRLRVLSALTAGVSVSPPAQGRRLVRPWLGPSSSSYGLGSGWQCSEASPGGAEGPRAPEPRPRVVRLPSALAHKKLDTRRPGRSQTGIVLLPPV